MRGWGEYKHAIIIDHNYPTTGVGNQCMQGMVMPYETINYDNIIAYYW